MFCRRSIESFVIVCIIILGLYGAAGSVTAIRATNHSVVEVAADHVHAESSADELNGRACQDPESKKNVNEELTLFLKFASTIITAVLGAILGAILKAWTDSRDAYRKALIPRVQEISEHLDGLLSTSTVFMHKCEALVRNPKLLEVEESKISRQKALDDVCDYKKKLSDDRRMIRCLLWDRYDRVDDAMRRLEKVCGWITQFMTRPVEGMSVLEQADNVRKQLDKIFALSCRRGQWPSWWQCRRLAQETRMLKEMFERDSEKTIVVGVDLPLPDALVLKYKNMVGMTAEDPIKGARALKMYERMLDALAKA